MILALYQYYKDVTWNSQLPPPAMVISCFHLLKSNVSKLSSKMSSPDSWVLLTPLTTLVVTDGSAEAEAKARPRSRTVLQSSIFAHLSSSNDKSFRWQSRMLTSRLKCDGGQTNKF